MYELLLTLQIVGGLSLTALGIYLSIKLGTFIYGVVDSVDFYRRHRDSNQFDGGDNIDYNIKKIAKLEGKVKEIENLLSTKLSLIVKSDWFSSHYHGPNQIKLAEMMPWLEQQFLIGGSGGKNKDKEGRRK